MSSFKADVDASLLLDECSVQQLAEQLAAQLREDEAAHLAGRTPSSLAVDIPRCGGRIDKRNRLAHRVAWVLWPPAHDAEKTWALIRYAQLISGLSKVIKEKWKLEEHQRLQAKRSAAHLDASAYCTLKSRPVSQHVLDPKPMPVQLTKTSELQPFFEFLKSNVWPFETPASEDYVPDKVEYQRGIFYRDGRMDLCKQVCGPGNIQELINSLQHNAHVKHFLLGNNIIGPAGARAISQFLSDSHPDIKTWYLAGNAIDSDGIAAISKSLGEDTTVKSLWLKRNPLGPAGAAHLSQLLQVNTTLQTLDLTHCGLRDEGVASLMQGLKANHGLQHLFLGANAITCKGAAAVGEYLQHCTAAANPGLVSLYLSVNRIGNEGVARMAEGLRGNTRLKRLVLCSNQIEDEGMGPLCAALSQHPSLQVLGVGMFTSTTDLGELPNRIGDEGALLLAGLIRSNHNLLLLDVSNNHLTHVGWAAMASAALESPSMVHVDVERFDMSNHGTLQQQFNAHLESNIQKHYGVARDVFLQQHLRYVRLPESVQYITSLYRTHDFQNKHTRQNVKKWWDEGDTTLQMVAAHA